MKSLKILFSVAVITLLTNISGINAFYMEVMNISNLKVPGHNGAKETSEISIQNEDTGTFHKLKNINTTDELDAQVVKNGNIRGPWVIVKNGKITQLTYVDSPATLLLTGGNFKIKFDSRWYYTKTTTLKKALWYLEY